jgi:hypothetical protein
MIQEHFDETRLKQIDPDFLEYELEMIEDSDAELIIKLLTDRESKQAIFERNPHNSIILYVTNLTDEFDFKQARSHTIGGSPPDCK